MKIENDRQTAVGKFIDLELARTCENDQLARNVRFPIREDSRAWSDLIR